MGGKYFLHTGMDEHALIYSYIHWYCELRLIYGKCIKFSLQAVTECPSHEHDLVLWWFFFFFFGIMGLKLGFCSARPFRGNPELLFTLIRCLDISIIKNNCPVTYYHILVCNWIANSQKLTNNLFMCIIAYLF